MTQNGYRESTYVGWAIATLAALLGILLAVSYSRAADMSRPAPVYTKAPLAPVAYNWSGFYITGFVDYSGNFANSSTSTTNANGAFVVDLNGIPHGPGVGGALEAMYQGSNTSWVLGARAEIGYANLQSTGNATFNAGNLSSLSFSNATNYLGNFNVIVGYAFEPQLLGYATGGFAFGGAHPNLAAASALLVGGSASQAISDTAIGWDAGAGLRYHFAGTPFDLGIEGLYTDLGSKQLSIIPIGGTTPILTSNARYQILTQKVTFSYKLLGAQ